MANRGGFGAFAQSVESGAVRVAFLATSGRAGSNLLQSLIDGHPQVLMMPTLFWFYFDWEHALREHVSDPARLVDAFLRKSSFAYDWYTTGLGAGRNETLALPRREIGAVLQRLIEESGAPVERARFFLMAHYAYAEVAGYPVANARVLLQHHHFPIASYGYRYLYDKISTDFTDGLPFFRHAQQDFPRAIFLHTLRNPFAALHSSLAAIRDAAGAFDPEDFYFNVYGLLAGFDGAQSHTRALGDRYQVVRYEDMHRKTETVMRGIATSLGIDFAAVLLSSTIGGKLWWGNNPARPINGTDPKFVTERWREELDPMALRLCAQLFNEAAKAFDYAPLEGGVEAGKRHPWIAGEVRGLVKALGRAVPRLATHAGREKLAFLLRYPALRRRLMAAYA